MCTAPRYQITRKKCKTLLTGATRSAPEMKSAGGVKRVDSMQYRQYNDIISVPLSNHQSILLLVSYKDEWVLC